MKQIPTVALVVVNRDGAEHLPACLDSIGRLDYPAERLETVVVDNGSTDGSLPLLRERYPWARVLPQERNLGFAEGVNVGASASAAELLALANNDMRLDPGWLRELVRLYEPDSGFPCVAGAILDWEGERIDFAGGFVNLHAFAGQEGFGLPLAETAVEDGRELAFACGGSMLMGRELFLALGGFDPVFFALLEDVDFGWRLHLAGHRVRLAAGARSFHRHGATTGSLPEGERLFLFERNALLMLLKNLDDENLGRFVAVALFLLAERTALVARDGETSELQPGIRAAADVLERLEAVLDERTRVQRLRRRSDREVLATFGRPFFAVHGDERYLQASALLTRLFALNEVVEERGRENRAATEEVRQLLALWREQYGVGRSAWWHVGRALSRTLPRPARRVLRRLARTY